MKLSTMKHKQVVSLQDGQILGYITDIEYDPNAFKIESFCVRRKHSCFSLIKQIFYKEIDMCISTQRFVTVGSDIILVDFENYKKK